MPRPGEPGLLRLLSGPQARISEVPDRVGKEQPTERTAASATSIAFANNLGTLRFLGLIEYPDMALFGQQISCSGGGKVILRRRTRS